MIAGTTARRACESARWVRDGRHSVGPALATSSAENAPTREDRSGGERTRTADFHVANVALYQLSYTPETEASSRFTDRTGREYSSLFNPRPQTQQMSGSTRLGVWLHDDEGRATREHWHDHGLDAAADRDQPLAWVRDLLMHALERLTDLHEVLRLMGEVGER